MDFTSLLLIIIGVIYFVIGFYKYYIFKKGNPSKFEQLKVNKAKDYIYYILTGFIGVFLGLVLMISL